MVIMKVKHKLQGAHVHCRVFTRLDVGDTWSKCGDLVFREAEWNEIQVTFECGGAEVEEDK